MQKTKTQTKQLSPKQEIFVAIGALNSGYLALSALANNAYLIAICVGGLCLASLYLLMQKRE